MLFRLLLTCSLVVGVLSGLVQGSKMAEFTSQAVSSVNSFAAGSVTISAGIAAGDSLSVSDLVPGDSFVAELILENRGTLPLWYSMSSAVTGASFGNALTLTVRVKTATPCSSLEGAVVAAPMSLAGAYFGQTEIGFQPGDRVLNPSASEALCFHVELPAGSSASLQGASATANLSFFATQQ